MNRGFFVTGTGTGVGKTFVTALLANQVVASGERVFAFKPIETGCPLVGSQRIGDDQELLARAAGDWQRGELRNLYCFEHPQAPLRASELAGRTVDLFHVKQVFEQGQDKAEWVFVEGAGGWRVPITVEADMSSLARLLGLPVIVVGTAALGTINHTMLTIEAVRRDGCEVSLVVLSRLPEVDLETAAANEAEVRRLSGCRVALSDELALRLLT